MAGSQQQLHLISPDGDEMQSKFEFRRSQVHDLAKEKVSPFLAQLEQKWQLDQMGDSHAPFRIGFSLYFTPEELGESGIPDIIYMERVQVQFARHKEMFAELFHRAVSLGMIDELDDDVNGNECTISSRINRLIDMADDAYETVFRYARQHERINHPAYVAPADDIETKIFRCSTMEFDDLTDYQLLILALLNETYNNNIRRYKGQCCKQIPHPDGHQTRAWKTFMPIAEFVNTATKKETRFHMWKNATSKPTNIIQSINYLNSCVDVQFPEIKKNRHAWSFRNGLMVGKEWSPKDGKYIAEFYPYESEKYRCLDPTVVSCKYFDQMFNPEIVNYDNWYDIPTPNMQGVLSYQKFSEDVCKWMYVMGGRLCFDVGDMDGWQVIPFLKGIARSGKSTLITKVFKKFYENDDVRALSNNIEKKFGLSSIYDGFMFIAPEVKGDLCLEQAEFQSIVSGEDISVAIKNHNAKTIEWKTPGILGGNEVPNWRDNSGSVLRRLIPWNFAKQVKDADCKLDEKLDAELPVILYKCVRAYLEYAQKYSGQDIWNVVPNYFKQVQTQVAMVTNTLHNFLASEKVRYGADLCVPQKVFVQNFNIHCHENNLGKVKFNPDFYAGPFSARDIEVRSEAITYKGRGYANQPVIFGVDVVEETIQFGEDY